MPAKANPTPAPTASKKDAKDAKKDAKDTNPTDTDEKRGEKNLDELDDAFEDFPADVYDSPDADSDPAKTAHVWEDTWEDEDQVEDFGAGLRAEHEKLAGPQPMKI
ncbi:hypothetical protein HDU93_003925 [Gonapodya sp. JEL0774]|nr:hypothetical protein HDU93_003925 [Gonapodya sp. JEL0774]